MNGGGSIKMYNISSCTDQDLKASQVVQTVFSVPTVPTVSGPPPGPLVITQCYLTTYL